MSDQVLVAPRPVDARPWTTPAVGRKHLDPAWSTWSDPTPSTGTPGAMFAACGIADVNVKTNARPAPGPLGDVT